MEMIGYKSLINRGKSLRLFDTRKVSLTFPKSVCVNHNDNVFVVSPMSEKITIFDRNGLLINQIPLSEGAYGICIWG